MILSSMVDGVVIVGRKREDQSGRGRARLPVITNSGGESWAQLNKVDAARDGYSGHLLYQDY